MIRKARTVTGRLTGPRTVELDEAVDAVDPRVEVVVTPQAKPDDRLKHLLTWLSELPPGGRSKEDIDAQIREERASWGDR